jgi:hypothetical protein
MAILRALHDGGGYGFTLARRRWFFVGLGVGFFILLLIIPLIGSTEMAFIMLLLGLGIAGFCPNGLCLNFANDGSTGALTLAEWRNVCPCLKPANATQEQLLAAAAANPGAAQSAYQATQNAPAGSML